MEHKKIEVTENGLKCDNPNCDWKDNSIKFHRISMKLIEVVIEKLSVG